MRLIVALIALLGLTACTQAEIDRATADITGTSNEVTAADASSYAALLSISSEAASSSIAHVLTWDSPGCAPIFRVDEDPCGLPGSYYDTH